MKANVLSIIAVFGLVTASCGADFGPGVPECRTDLDLVPGAVIVQVQAVPTAEFGPCIEDLRVGWEYNAQHVKLGEVVFSLDSDRMGFEFARISLVEACDTAQTVNVGEVAPGVVRFVRVHVSSGPVTVTVIPVAPRHGVYASRVRAEFNASDIDGIELIAEPSMDTGPPAERIAAALDRGEVVVVLDDREEALGTVELRRVGEEPVFGLTVEEVIEEIEEDLGDPRYRAEWLHQFEGGCVVYEIDAKGQGAQHVAADLEAALGFYPLGELRRGAETIGLDFGP